MKYILIILAILFVPVLAVGLWPASPDAEEDTELLEKVKRRRRGAAYRPSFGSSGSATTVAAANDSVKIELERKPAMKAPTPMDYGPQTFHYPRG